MQCGRGPTTIPRSHALSTPPANAAFTYSPGNYRTDSGDIFGRVSASESVLRAMARHGNVDTMYCLAYRSSDFKSFAEQIQAVATATIRARFIRIATDMDVSEPGCVFRSSPSIGWHAWHRRHGDARAYSICGLTHTTLEQPVLDSLGEILTAPTQPWDALICTSRAVKAMVETTIAGWGEYLAERFNGTAAPVIQLPMIPLGVECSTFARTDDAVALGKALRTENGVADEDVAVLYLGRLSFTEKANPAPMLVGLEHAARRSSKRLHLFMTGWFHKGQEEAMKAGAAKLAPSVAVHWLDGREPRVRRGIWFAADIFCSLPDNYQETFGLTPIEAMAAGLPVVVSDWDGYRDTVRDGTDGIRIPTLTPPAGVGWEIALRHHLRLDPYERYCGMSAQSVTVDAEAAANAFVALIEDENMRHKMGEAGRQRALDTYDWRHIIRAYQELWADLADRRRSASEVAPAKPDAPVNPLRDDPFRLFHTYGTVTFDEDSPVRLPAPDMRAEIDVLNDVVIATYPDQQLPPLDDRRQMIEFVADGEYTVGDVVERFAALGRHRVLLSLGWLSKHNLVRIGT
jgi:starch synthase